MGSENKQSPNEVVFNSLPTNVQTHMAPYIGGRGLLNLYRTAKSCQNFTVAITTKENNINKAEEKTLKEIYTEPSEELRKLLGYVLTGNWAEAEKIYSLKPHLLSQFGKMNHPNLKYDAKGKLVLEISTDSNRGGCRGSAYQMALMYEAYEKAEEMGKLMSFADKQAQFIEVFPDGEIKKYTRWDSTEKKCKPWDLEEAKKRIEAVMDAAHQDDLIKDNDVNSMNETTQKALKALQDYVLPSLDHTQGVVFDTNFFLVAGKLYETKRAKLTERERDRQPCPLWRAYDWCMNLWPGSVILHGYSNEGMSHNVKQQYKQGQELCTVFAQPKISSLRLK